MKNREIILNLWYIFDETGYVYSLRARCYLGSGNDEEKLALLHRFAPIDYLIAQPFPIPDRFHTIFVEGDTEKKMPVIHLTLLEEIGGPQVLFEDSFVALEHQLPSQTGLSIGNEPLLCMTPLRAEDNGELKPSFTSRATFGER